MSSFPFGTWPSFRGKLSTVALSVSKLDQRLPKLTFPCFFFRQENDPKKSHLAIFPLFYRLVNFFHLVCIYLHSKSGPRGPYPPDRQLHQSLHMPKNRWKQNEFPKNRSTSQAWIVLMVTQHASCFCMPLFYLAIFDDSISSFHPDRWLMTVRPNW